MKKRINIIICIVILGIGWSVYFENTTSGLKPTISGLIENEYKPHYVKTEINNYKKACLLNGWDDIHFLLSIRKDIETYEEARV